MKRSMIDRLVIAGLAFLFAFSSEVLAQRAEPRLALVIGNADYRSGALTTAANDAGLVAETLRADGFQVVGAANLDQDSLRRAFRDFLGQAAQAGPDAIVFVYLSGRGLQYEGENYFAPIEAVIARDSDIPIEALRVSDFTRALAAFPLRARIVVLDAARANAFAKNGQPLAGGLALVDAEPGSLYGFNAAPGTIAPDEPGPYGAYAAALAEMLRDGGVPIDEAFSRVRLRVDQVTHGAFMPWNVSKIDPPVILLPGAPKAPPPIAAQSYDALQSRPIREFPVEEAYAAAIERDTIGGYQDFLAAYPDSPLARRVRALLAARREALTWRRAITANTPNSYWTYMRRYPRGPHFWDARRRLVALSAPLEPPPRFEVFDFGGLPPPPPVEYEIIDRPVILFDPEDYPPPPPPPVYFLPPQPVEFIELAPPPPPQGPGFLPIPIPIPLPYAHPGAPRGVAIQQNFGQQGPVGAGQLGGPSGGGPGLSQQGGPGEAPLTPEQAPTHGRPNLPPAAPALPTPVPGAPQPSHAPPQGSELPPPGTPKAPQAPAPAGTAPPAAAPQGGKPGLAPTTATPSAPAVKPTPPAPALPTPIPGAAQPNHALPQGNELPVPGTPKAPRAPVPAGTAPPAAAPQGGRPGFAPPLATPGAPAPAVKPTPPAAPGEQAPSPGAAQPNHALPQGNELPPAVEPKAHPPQVPAGAPAPGAPSQAVKPAVAPPRPVGQGAPPSAGVPAPSTEPQVAPKVEPKPAPNHAAPEGERLPPPGAQPPHSSAPGGLPSLKPIPPAAAPQEQAAPRPAPQAKPKAPEPEAVHPNVPSLQPKPPAPAPAQIKPPPPPEARVPQPQLQPHPQEIKPAPAPIQATAPPPAQRQPPPKKPPGSEHEDELHHKEQ